MSDAIPAVPGGVSGPEQGAAGGEAIIAPDETPEQHVARAEKFGYTPDPWAVEILRLRAALRSAPPNQEGK